ncbi:MAG: hypothetical protein F6J93_27130 [Oscillatoria sp. SIO1A7]|nr:hypothetical protein [Oscillatoria sp. SIO1A7]
MGDKETWGHGGQGDLGTWGHGGQGDLGTWGQGDLGNPGSFEFERLRVSSPYTLHPTPYTLVFRAINNEDAEGNDRAANCHSPSQRFC